MSESGAPRGDDWSDIVEVLHTLANTMTARAHYPEGHPAIARADEVAGAGFEALLTRFPELVVALIDGEFVVSERPLPDLRDRLRVLGDAMVRHDIECIVFQRGVTVPECGALARAMIAPADAPGRVRAAAQEKLSHVLLRFVELRKGELRAGAATSAFHFVPLVVDLLGRTRTALTVGGSLDREGITSLAKDIVDCCSLRAFVLTQRCFTRTMVELATHATNVAMMSAAMALEAELPETICVDLTAAALLHDIGQLLLPQEIAGLPEPVLDEKSRPLFRNHTFAGASALLGAGAPPLWIAAALEHHRGIDGGGYPALESNAAPSELVRMIGLANFFDKKRTLLEGRVDSPDEVLRQAAALEDRYFGRPLVERFVHALGVHPPGTTIELSDREPALVVGANRTDPWRPKVLVLRGPRNGQRIDLKEVDSTVGRHTLSIVRAIPPPLLVLADVAGEAQVESSLAALPAAPSAVPLAASSMPDLLDRLVYPSSGFSSPPRALSHPPAPTARLSSMNAPPTIGSSDKPPSLTSSVPPRSSRPVISEEIVTLRPSSYAHLPRITVSIAAQRPPIPAIPPPPDPSASSVAPTPPAPKVRSAPPPAHDSDLEAVTPPGFTGRVLVKTGSIPPGLDHRGGFILTFVDGMSSVEDVIDASGLPQSDVLGILRELLGNGTLAIR